MIVLGSGPGGYVAAIRAAQLGLKTAIVERENLGGICLNWGCIPTKALLRSAEVLNAMKHAASYGLAADNVRADLDAVVKRSRGVAKQLNQGVTHLMKKNKITVHMGTGKLVGGGKLEVSGEKGAETISGKHIIIATGARARDLPFAKADGERIWTYRHAMTPKEMPTKLLVIGSGAIGIEFASFYNDMGAEVTVVEMMDRVVPVEDAEVSAFLEKALKKQGMTIHTGAGVQAIKADNAGVTATIKAKDGSVSDQAFSHVIVAVGIVPNVENIGLETLGIEPDKRFHIKTDGFGRTNVPGVWAIGDCGAQGQPRGGDRRRGDRAGTGQRRCRPACAGSRQHPRLHVLPPADRQRRDDRGEGQGSRARGARRRVPVHRQRQGDRAGRERRLREDGVRRGDRRTARRAHDRRRSDRDDPGLRRRADA